MTSKTKPIPIRFSPATLVHADAVAYKLSKKALGARVSRAEVIRLAVERGLTLLELEPPLRRDRN